MLWYGRSIRFSDAVLEGDLAATFLQYHPGVTVMWLSGFGLQLFARLRGLTTGHLQGTRPIETGVIAEAVRAGVLPLALTVALCIALSYHLIRRLAGRRVAFTAGVLLALDPLYIARSQVLHVDGLLATFMLVSALFVLNHVRHRRRSDLILSGVFGGLALLTKSPSLFLVPYTILVMGVHGLTGPEARLSRWRWWVGRTAVILRKVALWTLVAAVTFVGVWPAMWVTPMDVLKEIGQGINVNVEHAHTNPMFFNGRIVDPAESPGPLFYLVTLGWKTTLVTLPMLCVGVVLAVVRLRSDRRSSIIVVLIAAYAIFFTAQMCLGARMAPRYIVPAFLGVDIVAAFGVVWMAKGAVKARRWRSSRWVETAIPGALLILQAGVILPRHPYYGTLYNPLLGGARTARHMILLQQEGEGLDLAAQYLNALPDAGGTVVGVDRHGAEMVGRTFLGSVTAIDAPEADYRLYFINQVMRKLHVEEWGPLYALDGQRDPLYRVAFGGVPYVRIYRSEIDMPALETEYEVMYQLGDHIRLERVKLNAEMTIPGGVVSVKPYWVSDGGVEESYKVFCHVLSADKEMIGQRDDFPLGGSRPTSTWQHGEGIEDRYRVQLDREAEPGRYELSIGMYDPETMARVPVYTRTGDRALNDRIVLGEIVVADSEW
jgi:hypothetical protein